MQIQKPKYTITQKQESVIVTIHGTSFDQNICFNSFGGTHRSVLNSFAGELMRQKRLDVNKIFSIAKNYDRKHINTMGVTNNIQRLSGRKKIIF